MRKTETLGYLLNDQIDTKNVTKIVTKGFPFEQFFLFKAFWIASMTISLTTVLYLCVLSIKPRVEFMHGNILNFRFWKKRPET